MAALQGARTMVGGQADGRGACPVPETERERGSFSVFAKKKKKKKLRKSYARAVLVIRALPATAEHSQTCGDLAGSLVDR